MSLDARLSGLRASLFRSVSSLESTASRMAVMQQHLQHVQTEEQHARQLISSKQSDAQTERHLAALSDREQGRLQQEAARLQLRQRETEQAAHALQASRTRLQESLSGFQSSMQWSSEQLLHWSLASKQKEEDRALLSEYGRLDGVRLRELRKRLDAAAAQVEERRRQLQRVETDSAELVASSEQLSSEYRQLHGNRQRVMQDWERSVQRAMDCDALLLRLGEEVVDGRREAAAWEQRAAEAGGFSSGEERNNTRLRSAIDESERQNAKVRDSWQRQKAGIVELEEEVVTRRNVMEKLELEVRQAAEREQRLRQARQDKEQQMQQMQGRLQSAQAEYRDELSTLKSVASQHEHLTAALREAEAALAAQRQALLRRKEELYTLGTQLAAERQREERGVVAIANAQGSSKALQGKIHALDLQSLKQQEQLYGIEFVIQGLERKVNEASGRRSEEEDAQLRQLVQELTAVWREEERQSELMDAQLRRLQDELRAVRRRQDAAQAASSARREELGSLQVGIDAAQREQAAAERRLDELRVSHDKHKLDVLRLRARLQEEQDAVWQQERTRLDIEEAIAAREEEVRRYEELQRVELKAEEAERARLSREARERERSLDILSNRYATLHAKFVGSEQGRDEREQDDDGGGGGGGDDRQQRRQQGAEAHSQGYYIVRAGLEREEELKRQTLLRAEQQRLELDIEGVVRVCMEMEGKQGGGGRAAAAGVGAEQAELEAARAHLHELDSAVLELSARERADRRDVEQRKAMLAGLVSELGSIVQAVREREAEAAALDRERQRLLGSSARSERSNEQRQREWLACSRRGREEEKTAVSGSAGSGAGGEDASEDGLLLSLSLQDVRRRFHVLREVVRSFVLEHEALQSECGQQLRRALEADVRPSSAASSIVSHLSDEKEQTDAPDSRQLSARSQRSSGSDSPSIGKRDSISRRGSGRQRPAGAADR